MVKKSVYKDRIQELKDQLAAMELERDKWREATQAMGDEGRAVQWMAMVDVVKAAESAMTVLDGVSMVFSRQSGKTSIGRALVPLMEALARYRHGPESFIAKLGVPDGSGGSVPVRQWEHVHPD